MLCNWGLCDTGNTHLRSHGDNTIWIAPSVCVLRTVEALFFTVNLHSLCLNWAATVRQRVSYCWVRIILTVVSRSYPVLSVDMLVSSTARGCFWSCETGCIEVHLPL